MSKNPASRLSAKSGMIPVKRYQRIEAFDRRAKRGFNRRILKPRVFFFS